MIELISVEKRVAELFEQGKIRGPVHLSGGNEEELVKIFHNIDIENDWVLSTHRWHYHYLLKGGTEDNLIDHLIHKPYESMMMQDRKLKFISTGIVGGLIYTALGLGMAGEKVWCFIGDAACDSGQLHSAVRYVDINDLPITYIIEDNDRSCCTNYEQRWGKGFPEVEDMCIDRYSYKPTWPHVGVGKHISF